MWLNKLCVIFTKQTTSLKKSHNGPEWDRIRVATLGWFGSKFGKMWLFCMGLVLPLSWMYICNHANKIDILVTYLSQEIDPLFKVIITYLKDGNTQGVALSRNHGKTWDPILGQRKESVPPGQSEYGKQRSSHSPVHHTAWQEWWGKIPCRIVPNASRQEKQRAQTRLTGILKKRAICFDKFWQSLYIPFLSASSLQLLYFYNIQSTSPMTRSVLHFVI